MGNPIQDSLLWNFYRQDAIDALASAILGMNGDTAITVVGVSPEAN